MEKRKFEEFLKAIANGGYPPAIGYKFKQAQADEIGKVLKINDNPSEHKREYFVKVILPRVEKPTESKAKKSTASKTTESKDQ